MALLSIASALLAVTFLSAAGIVLFFSWSISIDGQPLSWLAQTSMAIWFVLVAAGLTALAVLLWRISGRPSTRNIA